VLKHSFKASYSMIQYIQHFVSKGGMCGPLSSPSFSGRKYFLNFIVDFSKCTLVYFLKLKSEVFDKFLACKALVEKQSRHQLQRLRIDNGGEYVNNNFTSYYTA
jgi:hypothetical protein